MNTNVAKPVYAIATSMLPLTRWPNQYAANTWKS